jgi:hypothetical protein
VFGQFMHGFAVTLGFIVGILALLMVIFVVVNAIAGPVGG